MAIQGTFASISKQQLVELNDCSVSPVCHPLTSNLWPPVSTWSNRRLITN